MEDATDPLEVVDDCDDALDRDNALEETLDAALDEEQAHGSHGSPIKDCEEEDALLPFDVEGLSQVC
jgi:hypothetical protein